MNLLSNPHHPCYHDCHEVITAVPEPSTFAMICVAGAVVALLIWINRRKS